MLASIIRTVVPFVVGLVLTLLAKVGLQDLVDTEDLTDLVTLVVGAAYYAVVRWLEEKVNPRFGWLLGYPAPPRYATPAEAAAGLEPVPPSEVVAQIGPATFAADDPFVTDYGAALGVVAGPASSLPNGTPVEIRPA